MPQQVDILLFIGNQKQTMIKKNWPFSNKQKVTLVKLKSLLRAKANFGTLIVFLMTQKCFSNIS